MITIPTSTEADYTISVVLEGESYDFRFQWNTREEAWYAYLGLSGVEYTAKVKLTNGHDLINHLHHMEGIPPGQLWMVDSTAFYGRPKRSDFSQFGRFMLIYIGEDELG